MCKVFGIFKKVIQKFSNSPVICLKLQNLLKSKISTFYSVRMSQTSSKISHSITHSSNSNSIHPLAHPSIQYYTFMITFSQSQQIIISHKLTTCQLLYFTNTYKPREILVTILFQLYSIPKIHVTTI